MKQKKINSHTVGGLLLLLFLLAMHFSIGTLSRSSPEWNPHDERVFVQVSGDITYPGVYGFSKPPDLKEVLIRGGGVRSREERGVPLKNSLYDSGDAIVMPNDEKESPISIGEITAFYKITLGIPISINNETLEGLTAIPGIGPKIARAIILERAKRSGFQRLDQIMSIPGIGPTLYNKVARYLVL